MKIIMFTFLFVALFASCASIVKVEFDQENFNAQRQMWQSSNVKDYQYRLRAVGYMMYDGTIIVENSEYKEDLPSEASVWNNPFKGFNSIDELYRYIEEQFTSTNNKRQRKEFYLKEIRIEYDEINHIPIEIHYVYYFSPNVVVDGTFDFFISDFQRINK